MPKETVNRRVQFTKTALRDAMIELICEKPLTSITVKDVCARADINRSTFYLHYKDVDSLLVAVEDYAIEYIQSHFKGLGNAFDELVGFLTYMKNTPRLRNLFFALAGERGDPRFTRRLQELTFQNSCLFLRAAGYRLGLLFLADRQNAEHVGGAAGLSAPEAHTARRDRSRRGSVPVRQQPGLTLPAASAIIGCSSISYMK